MAWREQRTAAAGVASTRRDFIERLGKTLAIGLGVAVAPVAVARASLDGNTHCCPSTCDLPGGGSCAPGTRKYFCTGCASCCICLTGTSCLDFTGGCIC